MGSGTVGEAVQEVIFGGFNKKEPGLELKIVKIFTRHPKKKKWYRSHSALFTTDPSEVTDHPEADIIIEALGTEQERELSAFRDYIIRSLRNGKPVVTSDKAVLAKFGREIWEAAEKYGQEIRFEACVGGGIPIIRSLTESFAAELPEAIYGVINGTSNYILSEMGKRGKSYGEALREAQQRGYAETNPKVDVSGLDAEAKLILLAAVTFGLHVGSGMIWRKGIEEIHPVDFFYADRKGHCTIKPLAVARSDGDAIQAFVAPALVSQDHFLASIDGATNAIFFCGKRSAEPRSEGKESGRDWHYAFVGPGAGGGPTAVAMMGDVWEIARGRRGSAVRAPSLVPPGTFHVQPQDRISACFYIRFVVKDRVGIVGDICQAFAQARINVAEIWQLNHSQDELESLARSYRLKESAREILPFVITLERTTVAQIGHALETVRRKDYILAEPFWLPMWGIG